MAGAAGDGSARGAANITVKDGQFFDCKGDAVGGMEIGFWESVEGG